MGLFDLFSKKADTTFVYAPGEHEGWVAVLFACMLADGDMDDAEIDSLAKMLTFKTKFKGINIGSFFNSILAAKEKIGGAGLVEAGSKAVKQEDKETLFAMSVELVLADGEISKDEELIIETLAKSLEISDTTAAKIIEVMLIRNKGNVVFN